MNNDIENLSEINDKLANKTALQRISFGLEQCPGEHAVASSFGAQSAVSLHLLTTVDPNIPVILIDTGYLFAETYRFVEQLSERLNLNLKVYRSDKSAAWQEAVYGKQWLEGSSGLKNYNYRNKVEPMERALKALNIGTWFAGLRRQQSISRKELPIIQSFKNRIKIHPIIDWDNKKVHQYLEKHHLPYHPLWEKGYVSIGDVHSTKPLSGDMSEEETRFSGIQRECGLHVDTLSSL